MPGLILRRLSGGRSALGRKLSRSTNPMTLLARCRPPSGGHFVGVDRLQGGAVLQARASDLSYAWQIGRSGTVAPRRPESRLGPVVYTQGSHRVNVEPTPASLDTVTPPPRSSASRRLMARPSPAPPSRSGALQAIGRPRLHRARTPRARHRTHRSTERRRTSSVTTRLNHGNLRTPRARAVAAARRTRTLHDGCLPSIGSRLFHMRNSVTMGRAKRLHAGGRHAEAPARMPTTLRATASTSHSKPNRWQTSFTPVLPGPANGSTFRQHAEHDVWIPFPSIYFVAFVFFFVVKPECSNHGHQSMDAAIGEVAWERAG